MLRCDRCERDFKSDSRLRKHLLKSSDHFYCCRCNKEFVSKHALNQHLQSSRMHWICQKCDDEPDFPTSKQRQHHWMEEHFFCRHCNCFYRQFKSQREMQEHKVEEHGLCTKCSTFFWLPANLRAVCYASGLGVLYKGSIRLLFRSESADIFCCSTKPLIGPAISSATAALVDFSRLPE